MDMPVPKTLEEHRQYLYDIVHLKLWFLHRYLAKHPEEDFVTALHTRVNIYRKTDAYKIRGEVHWDDPEWVAMEQAAQKIYRETPDASAFEKAAFAVFQESIDRFAPRDFEDHSSIAGFQCGCLRFEPVPRVPGRLHFHIMNPIQPLSIFADPLYFPCCLRLLCRQAQVMGLPEIATGTWLNETARFRQNFPEIWQENMGERETDLQLHNGFWGQFINARGTFNRKYGDLTRSTGDLVHYPRYSHAPVEAVLAHTEKLLRAGPAERQMSCN